MLVLKDIKPLGDSVITTGDRYDEVYTDGGLIDPSKSGQFKEYQKVLFASEAAIQRGITKDDLVYVNFFNYARPVQKKNNSIRNDMEEHYNQELMFHIPVLEVDKKECLDLRINDVKFVILEMEDQDFSRLTKLPGLVDVTGKKIKK